MAGRAAITVDTTATGRRHVEGRAIQVEAPAAWGLAVPSAGADVALEGPTVGGRVPLVSVRLGGQAASVDAAAEQFVDELCRRHPGTLVASRDVWPHPVWGDGLLVQTARLDDDATVAHDCYVFLHRGRVIRIEVACPLVDLLSLEDDLADIVAHTRPRAA